MKDSLLKFVWKKRIILVASLLILITIQYAYLLNLSKTKKDPIADRCSSLSSNAAKLTCWQDLMDQTLASSGLGPAFDLLDKLFTTQPAFAAECHGYAHTLGQKTYTLFSEKQDFELNPKSSYCGYGFYHGFMETLLLDTGDMNQARSFCEEVDKKLSVYISDAGGACYHGIGHGAVDGSDPRTWGDPNAMIKTGLSLCEKVSSDEIPAPRYGKLFRCITGVYNALEIYMDSNQFKLTPDYKDPFSVCRTQPEKYKESCYSQFVVSAIQVANKDFDKVAEFIDTIAEDNYAIFSLQALVVEKANSTDSYAETIDFCRNLPSRFNMGCITAYGEGFLKYGPPQNEYKKDLDFCGSPFLTELEKVKCFDRVLSLLRNFYTAEKSQEICNQVKPVYRQRECSYQ